MMKYFSFEGLASRSEFWGVYVLSWIAILTSIFLMSVFASMEALALTIFSVIAFLVIALSSFWISLATGARRCREADINPWWTAAQLIPYLGVIVTIVLGCIPPDNAKQA